MARRRGRTWMSLVRRYGVLGAARRYSGKRRRRRRNNPGNPRNPSGYIRVRRRGRPRWRPIGRYMRRRRRSRGRRRAGQFLRFRAPRGYVRVAANPPRRRRRRYYRDNPRRRRYSRRGRRGIRLLDNPVAAITQRIESLLTAEGIGDFLQGMGGFGGALFGGQLLRTQVGGFFDTPLGRILGTFGSSLILSALSGYVVKGSAKRVFQGGMLATGWRILSELVPAESRATFPLPLLSGMGASDGFRQAIEAEVLKQLRGGGVTGLGETFWIQPAGIEQYYARPAGVGAYLTEGEAGRLMPAEQTQAMGAFMTAKEATRAAGMQGMATYDEFSGAFSPERF